MTIDYTNTSGNESWYHFLSVYMQKSIHYPPEETKLRVKLAYIAFITNKEQKIANSFSKGVVVAKYTQRAVLANRSTTLQGVNRQTTVDFLKSEIYNKSTATKAAIERDEGAIKKKMDRAKQKLQKDRDAFNSDIVKQNFFMKQTQGEANKNEAFGAGLDISPEKSAKRQSICPFPRRRYDGKIQVENSRLCLNESNKTKNTMATRRGEQNDDTCPFCYQILTDRDVDEYFQCIDCTRLCCSDCVINHKDFNWIKDNNDDEINYLCTSCKQNKDKMIYEVIPE
jgi:hypothetical protein